MSANIKIHFHGAASGVETALDLVEPTICDQTFTASIAKSISGIYYAPRCSANSRALA